MPPTRIVLGGGNTYHLLHQLRTSGFAGAIAQFAAEGRPLYGGSAGGIALGRNIGTCAHMDENAVGLKDRAGLDLIHGHAVWCHYRSADDPLLHAYVAETQISTIALAETSGLWVRGPGRLQPLGTSPVLCFTPTGRQLT